MNPARLAHRAKRAMLAHKVRLAPKARLAPKVNEVNLARLAPKVLLARPAPKVKKAILARKARLVRRVNRASLALPVGIITAMANLTKRKMPIMTASMTPSIVWDLKAHRAQPVIPARRV